MIGRAQVIATIRKRALRAYHRGAYVGANVVVAAAGNSSSGFDSPPGPPSSAWVAVATDSAPDPPSTRPRSPSQRSVAVAWSDSTPASLAEAFSCRPSW